MTRKQKIRAAFRLAVFERDGYRCVGCGFQSTPQRAEHDLDAHHITPRESMPAGGYVVENGVTLCAPELSGGKLGSGCHWKAELALEFTVIEGADGSPDWLYQFSDARLYAKIGSSRERAEAACAFLERTMKTGEPTFMTLVILGKITDPTKAINDYIDRWHSGNETMSPHEYLGMSWDDYGRWLQDPKVLATIIKEASERWNAIVEPEKHHDPHA